MKATVIFDTCREGSLNMALDSLLLQQLREEEQVFLRFYTCVQRLCPLVYSKSGSSNNILLTRGSASYRWKSCSSFARCELLICWTS